MIRPLKMWLACVLRDSLGVRLNLPRTTDMAGARANVSATKR